MAVYLAYSGMQDMFLTENPDFTHFKTLFSREIPYSTKVVEQAFDKTEYRPGDTLISTLRQNGDYISGISLKVKLPSLTPSSQNWVYPDFQGFFGKTMRVIDSSTGSELYTIVLNGLLPTTQNTNWFNISNSAYSVTISNNKFVFPASGTSYVVFDDIEIANFWGFVYNPIQLFGGFVKFNIQNQVTFQESGWLSGNQVYSGYSYLDDTIYKLINSISLFIGKQCIQEFDSKYIKFYKDTNTTYKNRPVLKLLEGDDNTVDFERIYYFEIPFIKIPVHALTRQDVQIRLKTNPVDYVNFYTSLVISFNSFNEKLPLVYNLHVPQVSYFENSNLDIRGPLRKLIIVSPNVYSFELNGETFINESITKTSAYYNLTNLPTQSNVYIFNNPLNMSRIRNKQIKTTYGNVNVYAETVNFLNVSNDISGLTFDTTENTQFPKVTGSLINPGTQAQVYLFNEIGNSVSSIQSFYSMRLVNPSYTGPIVRVRNSVTNEESDFYTDTTQSYLKTIDGTTISSFGTDLRVSVFYDQSINKNNMVQTSGTKQPKLSVQNGKYVLNFFNSYLGAGNNPECFMYLVNSVHPRQCTMSIKMDTLGSFFEPITIFGRANGEGDLRSPGANFYNGNSFDWAYWVGTGSNSAQFYIDNVNTAIMTSGSWKTITSYFPLSAYSGSDVVYIGASSPGFYTTPLRSLKGYLFEIGFLANKTMQTDYSNYYANRPPVF